MLRKTLIIILVIITAITTSSCNKEQKKYQASFLVLFNTITELQAYFDSKEQFSEFATFIRDNLEEYHYLYDKYNSYEGINNIKTINDNAGKQPVKVDKRIIELLLFSKEMFEMTKGKTNIAMGAVLEIWHDYRTDGIDDPENAKLPPREKLTEAATHCDIDKVLIDEVNETVYLEDEFMSLDVGAIAKGYATEQVGLLAIEAGYKDYLLSVGGNIRASGVKSSEDNKWSIGIQNPDLESDDKTIMSLYVTDVSVVSSGDYERYYTVEGKRYNHIINPETLMPSDFFTAVTVVCPDSGLADALSTAIYSMDFEAGYEMIKKLDGVEALWILPNGEMKYSDGYQSLIK